MRVLVTGSRTWPDQDLVWQALFRVVLHDFRERSLTVVHGGCPEGADLFAHHWCQANPKVGLAYIVEEIHWAAWRLDGRGAGFQRNHRMGNTQPDLCLAFIDACHKPGCPRPSEYGYRLHGSHGATDCADYATSKGIAVKRWRV